MTGEISNLIDVTPNNPASQFDCFTNRDAATHERVKDNIRAEIIGGVVALPEIF